MDRPTLEKAFDQKLSELKNKLDVQVITKSAFMGSVMGRVAGAGKSLAQSGRSIAKSNMGAAAHGQMPARLKQMGGNAMNTVGRAIQKNPGTAAAIAGGTAVGGGAGMVAAS